MHFHHVSFTVSDVDAAERWFMDAFGMERIGGGHYDFDYIRSQTGYQNAVLKIALLAYPGRDDLLELIEYKNGAGAPGDTATNRPGNAHLCFVVANIDAEYERLSAMDVTFRSLPNRVTYGVNKGARAVYLVGPDDIRLELFQPAPGGAA